MAKHTFSDFMREIEDEAKAEGTDAVEELQTFRAYYRLAREMMAARKEKGISQAKLAEKCGVHQSEISDIERARANPTFATLQTIARGLDRRIAVLPLKAKALQAPTKARAARWYRGVDRARAAR